MGAVSRSRIIPCVQLCVPGGAGAVHRQTDRLSEGAYVKGPQLNCGVGAIKGRALPATPAARLPCRA